jgi:predicted ATPase
LIEAALASCERTEERWCVPELLRIGGELALLMHSLDSAVVAEGQFLRALNEAREQAALSWELRAATSLTRLWRDQGRRKDGYDLLARVYDQFTEGFETADLKTAKALIEELQ